VHGDSKRQGVGTNVEANNTRGGRPVRHEIPLGIIIFLVLLAMARWANINSSSHVTESI